MWYHVYVVITSLTVLYVMLCANMSLWCFFFQAEDGIRYLVRSRGLGDVYKRQAPAIEGEVNRAIGELARPLLVARAATQGVAAARPVSYTHLTLPTSDLV